MTDKTLEAVARAICAADTTAPEPDAPIYSGMKACKAWEGRTGMAQAAIDAHLKAISDAQAKACTPRALAYHGYVPGSHKKGCGDCDKRHKADKSAYRCLECATARVKVMGEPT